MKIINLKHTDLDSMINEWVSTEKNVKRIGAFPYWKKLQPLVQLVIAVTAFLLGRATKWDEILFVSNFYRPQSGIADKILFVLLLLGTFLVCSVVYCILHELLHAVPDCKEWRHYYIVLNFPMTISVISARWVTKKQELLRIIFPCLFFLLGAGMIYLCTGDWMIPAWITLINIAFSSSDIAAFFLTMAKVPKNARILGDYYCEE